MVGLSLILKYTVRNDINCFADWYNCRPPHIHYHSGTYDICACWGHVRESCDREKTFRDRFLRKNCKPFEKKPQNWQISNVDANAAANPNSSTFHLCLTKFNQLECFGWVFVFAFLGWNETTETKTSMTRDEANAPLREHQVRFLVGCLSVPKIAKKPNFRPPITLQKSRKKWNLWRLKLIC